MERRLAAILLTDIVGYSRLMGLDEEGTIARQKKHREEVIDPKVSAHGGRIVKTTGDGLLVEFPSIVDAVRCAVEVQMELAGRDTDAPEDRPMQYRIGINLGDIVIDGDDILGDGVNVAARLEGLAEPGGVCISGVVYDQLAGKLDIAFEDAGEQTVKNVPRPLQVWHWQPDGAVHRSHDVGASLPLPNKPSIAVLPFVNMSGEPEQEFFADGMTEDIITGLSRFRSLFVIARNSTFAYKGKSSDVRDVARDLGVRYVLEGSVRRGGDRIRITGQLIEAETGNHLWAERYDQELGDIFSVQDQVTEAIVAAIAPEISLVERNRAQRKPPSSLQAWDVYQRGIAAFHSSATEDDFRLAIDQFDRVNEIDPTFAPAFAMAATGRTRYVGHFAPSNRAVLLNDARNKSNRAIALDPHDPLCLWSDGRVQSLFGNHDIAISRTEEALALNPSDAMSHHYLGVVLCTAGRPEKAIAHFDQAMRLSPRDTFLPGMQTYKAFALFDLELYDEALDWVRRARLSPHPRPLTLALSIALATTFRQPQEVQAALRDLKCDFPRISCSTYRENSFGRPEVMERLVDALREAGLPE